MKHFKIIIISILIALSSALYAQNNYISQYKTLASELSKEYGIPSSIILSIAFVETGGGTSKMSKVLKNHFGIVGKNTITKSKYKSFNSAQESYIAFCKIISKKKYYAELKGNNNHHEWITAIANSGYSTNPTEWKKRLNYVITKFSL